MTSWQDHRGHRTSTHRQSVFPEPLLAAILLQIVDVCLLSTVFVVPYFFGGNSPLGRFLFVTIASTAGATWFIRQVLLHRASSIHTLAHFLGMAALLLVALQIAPLPAEWLEQIATRNNSLLSLWNSDSSQTAALGAWPSLSLAPSSTKVALATLVAYVLLFTTAVQRLEHLSDIEQLLKSIAVAAIVMSAFGLVQFFTNNGKFFWFYEHPFTTTTHAAKGSFACRNHFAHFLVLGIGPLLAWIVLRLQSSNPERSRQSLNIQLTDILLCAGLPLVVFAVLLSLSRGGMVALGVAIAVSVLLLYFRGVLSSTFLYGLAALSVLVVGMLSAYGYDNVASRLDDLASGSIGELDSNRGRRKIWEANLAATRQGGLFGAGAGSHREIYPVYLPESLTIEYTHAENGYLQIATECGYLGIGLLAIAILMVAYWCWQAVRRAPSVRQLVAAVAATSGLAASIVHALVDFVWFIPACMSFTILLSCCALRLAQLASSDCAQPKRATFGSRIRWTGLAVSASLASLWAITATLGPARADAHWRRYLLSSQERRYEGDLHRFSMEQTVDQEKTGQLLTENMIAHLRKVLAYDPDSARANLRLAGKYLQLFDMRQKHSANSMPIDQIRDAAIASQFASSAALQQWLQQAFGKNSALLYLAYYHTQKSLQLCPLQGEGYLYLANLCFLKGHDHESIDAYLQQSLQVRPHDGQVLFEAGRQELLLGRYDKSLTHWQQIFLEQGSHQIQIIRLLAGQIPAADFLESFPTDWRTLVYLWQWYQQVGNPEDIQHIVRQAESLADKECPNFPPERAAYVWRSLAQMQQTLAESDHGVLSLSHAYEVAPDDYLVRKEYGLALLKAQEFRLAESHLRWCLARKPDDSVVHSQLVLAANGALAQSAKAQGNIRR